MSRCVSPFTVKDTKTKNSLPVPCGKCIWCLKRRVSTWSFRLLQESRVSSSAFFVTLTYEGDHIPETSNGLATIDKADVQKFIKRLRRRQEIKGLTDKIKYYACGEYGKNSFRPHYHLILFNSLEEIIEKAWQKGHVHIGKVSEASIGYTLKYMSKGKTVPQHELDDRNPEFSLMSKRLGANYINNKTIKWHREDILRRCYCPLPNGKKAPMARYYKEKLYTKRELKKIGEYMQTLDPKNPANYNTIEDWYLDTENDGIDEINRFEAAERKKGKENRRNLAI